MSSDKHRSDKYRSHKYYEVSHSTEHRVVLNRLNKIAQSLDAKFRIPGTQIRFGWDSLIGFIPVLGDLIGILLSAYLISQARKVDAPFRLQARMAGNVLIDVLFGLIPVVGDAFDIFWKANLRNIRLLKSYSESQIQPPDAKSNVRIWWATAFIIIVVVLLLLLFVETDIVEFMNYQ